MHQMCHCLEYSLICNLQPVTPAFTNAQHTYYSCSVNRHGRPRWKEYVSYNLLEMYKPISKTSRERICVVDLHTVPWKQAGASRPGTHDIYSAATVLQWLPTHVLPGRLKYNVVKNKNAWEIPSSRVAIFTLSCRLGIQTGKLQRKYTLSNSNEADRIF